MNRTEMTTEILCTLLRNDNDLYLRDPDMASSDTELVDRAIVLYELLINALQEHDSRYKKSLEDALLD